MDNFQAPRKRVSPLTFKLDQFSQVDHHAELSQLCSLLACASNHMTVSTRALCHIHQQHLKFPGIPASLFTSYFRITYIYNRRNLLLLLLLVYSIFFHFYEDIFYVYGLFIFNLSETNSNIRSVPMFVTEDLQTQFIHYLWVSYSLLYTNREEREKCH
jgi:hypothetical protein